MKIFYTFTLFGSSFTLHYLGLFLLMGLAVFLMVAYFELKKRNIEVVDTFDNILLIVFFGLLGGRVLFVLLNVSYYFENVIEIPRFWYGGFYFEGAFLAAFAYILFWLRREKKKRVLGWLDALIVATLPAQAFTNMGVYFSQREAHVSDSLGFLAFQVPQPHIFETVIYIVIYLAVLILYWGYRKDLKDGFLFYAVLIMLSFVHLIFTPQFGQISLFTIGDYLIFPSHLLFLFILTGAVTGLIMHTGKLKRK